MEPMINSTVTLLQSSVKDIFLNVTETTQTSIVFENTTAIMLNVNNETLNAIMSNMSNFAHGSLTTTSRPKLMQDFHRIIFMVIFKFLNYKNDKFF